MRHPLRAVIATCRTCARRTTLACALTLLSLAPLAWDVERMAQAAQRLGPQAVHGVRALQPLLGALAEADDATRLDGVNRFFNRRIVFRDDMQVWHVEDYWASPLETLQQGMCACDGPPGPPTCSRTYTSRICDAGMPSASRLKYLAIAKSSQSPMPCCSVSSGLAQ